MAVSTTTAPELTAVQVQRILVQPLEAVSAFLFSQVAVARDQAPSVKILDQTFGDFDQQALRVTARYDAAPLNAQAVVVLSGITV